MCSPNSKLPKKKPVTTKIAKKLAKDINAMGYYECSAKDMTGLKEIFDEAIRTVINLNNHHKKLGKFCWSTTCRNKLPLVHKSKCHRCRHWYCNYCIEIWEDGFKGCPECIINEKEARKRNNLPIPTVKKAGKTGKDKKDGETQTNMTSSNKVKHTSSETHTTNATTSQTSTTNTSEEDNVSDNAEYDDEDNDNKRTKVVGGIRTGNLLIESDSEEDIDSEEFLKKKKKN